MISRIIERFEREVIAEKTHCRTFFDTLKDEPEDLVIEFARWVLSMYTYETNAKCVKAAFHILAHARDIPSFEKLEQLRGIWKNTYLDEYAFLLELLRNAKDGAICNCDVYQDSCFNVPPYQDELELIYRREDDNPNEIQIVRCKICKTEWEVEIDYSYHYPHSHWRKHSS